MTRLRKPNFPTTLLVLPLFLLPACKPQTEASAENNPKPAASFSATPHAVTRVETATVRPSSTEVVLNFPGEVEAARDAFLAAPLGGFIEKVNISEGDQVKKGQILALIDTTTHQVRRNQTKVELDAAQRELDRAKKLGDALPAAQLDAAESRLAAAKAAYRSADVQVARSVITAPFSGTVARNEAEVGEVAAPGAPLIRIVQLDHVKVSVSLSDRDVIAVKPGMKAFVTTDARSTVMEGVLDHVRAAADMDTRAFTGEIRIDNGESLLRPGMIASVQIQLDSDDGQQMIIPQDWLVTKPGKLGVFINVNGVAEWRVVKVGKVVRDQVIVLEGLKVGDELVINGHRELAQGDPLLVARKGVCCTEGRAVFSQEGATAPTAAK
ncbi:MAG: efflux RND transporter periplasmic adaptor subunit [Myxococcales bacterium]|nr:efflux RND transporter periplasmic adaptor subunit [Myxococcales bacterium]